MAAHTVASVAGRVLVVERETALQDKRITACEATSATLLDSMARVETNMKAVVRSTNGKEKEKKPKRLEIMAVVITALVGLQTLGILDGIRAAISGWLAGGAG